MVSSPIMRHMNLIARHKKVHRKYVPRTVVVARPNIMWETDFTCYNIGEKSLNGPVSVYAAISLLKGSGTPFN